MCIPHAPSVKPGTYVKKDRDKVQKSIERVSQEEFEKGDPNFIDERTTPYTKKKKTSFIESLLE